VHPGQSAGPPCDRRWPSASSPIPASFLGRPRNRYCLLCLARANYRHQQFDVTVFLVSTQWRYLRTVGTVHWRMRCVAWTGTGQEGSAMATSLLVSGDHGCHSARVALPQWAGQDKRLKRSEPHSAAVTLTASRVEGGVQVRGNCEKLEQR
jgi:hypothetical protein